MKKFTLTTSLLLITSMASALNEENMTCYEYHFNAIPAEVRNQQAQSIQQVYNQTSIGLGVSAVMLGSGVIAFKLVEKAYPAQGTATNISTAATYGAGGVLIAGAAGEIILSSVTSNEEKHTKIRRLSDEAYTGGKTFDAMALELTQTANEVNKKNGNPQRYNLNSIKDSMSQVLINTPELCNSKNPSVVMINIWNATLSQYHSAK